MKIFFATDIHGSEICWRKFLNAAAFYKADLVVLGGDVTGKIMVPIVARNGYWEVTIRGEKRRLENREALEAAEKQLRDRGSYPAIVTPDELDELSTEQAIDERFNTEMTRSLDRWLDMADGKLRGGDIPCILNGGNDDIFEIDPILEASPCVTFAEGKVLDLDGWSMVSMGWTNPTPWNTHREAPEDELAGKIDAVAGAGPRHEPDDLQLPRPAVRHRPRRGARARREHAAHARRRGHEAGGLHRDTAKRCSGTSRRFPCTGTFTKAAAWRGWAAPSPLTPAVPTATACSKRPSSI